MSSDSDEFYDAEDITPHKLSKKNLKSDTSVNSAKVIGGVVAIDQNFPVNDSMELKDKNEELEKKVMEGRKRFQELRQLIQTDEEDGAPTNHSTPDSQNSSVEGVFPALAKTSHPFRIIEHDAMSLQSMTSLGRIGRILGGSVESSTTNTGKESVSNQSASSREPSGKIDVKPSTSQTQEQAQVMPMEPDVIASTKSNSLKNSRTVDSNQCIMTLSESGSTLANSTEVNLPVAPPRRRKKAKVSTSQSLCSPDSDSIGSHSQEEGKREHVQKPPPLQNLYIQTPSLSEILNVNSGLPLPSPASTIESLTREFQNSLDLEKAHSSQGKGTIDYVIPLKADTSRALAASAVAITTSSSSIQNSLDIRAALKGQYVVKPQDEEKARASGPSAQELERLGRLRSPEGRASVPRTTGHSSLGAVHSNNGSSPGPSSQANTTPGGPAGRRERRRSAGDEGALRQLNMLVRTRTDSGKQLTDMEILEQVTVLNLDTGELVPLSVAEDKIPQCINPLSLHIMRLTSEYVSNSSIYDEDKNRESDEESLALGSGIGAGLSLSDGSGRGTGGRGGGSSRGADGSTASSQADEPGTGGLRRKTAKLKRFLGSTVKKTMDKAKSIAQEVSHARHKEDISDIVDEVHGEHNIKLKASSSHKGPYDFEGCVRHVQEVSGWHNGPVWCMKFSACGRLLATAGQDRLLRVWVLRDAFEFFQDMRTKYNADAKSSPTPSQESLASLGASVAVGGVTPGTTLTSTSTGSNDDPPGPAALFAPRPFCTYSGHTSDLLDVSWSKNYFILSSSMDKTVRLWHISRGECLCCFQHIDFVTAIAFHPRDDRYFLSGSLDGKLRLWNIPDKKVAVWNEVDGQTKLITAANFCQNGKFAVVGTYDGRCIFYTTDQLKYHTQIDVKSTRGKNSTGRKISGIEPMPGEDKILVTSNDSRIRLYDLRDLNLSCKYKGYVNVSSQIKASFSHDGKYIVSGSENQCIYIWKTHHDYSKFSSVRRDRNDFWEGIKAHSAVVTCAVFAPNPESVLRMIEEREREARTAQAGDDNPVKEVTNPISVSGHILVSADFTGCIRVFVNKAKPKHSSLPASAMA